MPKGVSKPGARVTQARGSGPRIAQLADLHLGFRQYHRQTPQGINQREADVAQAFRAAIDGVIAARPDIVLFAGDIFHSVRPTNPAILDSFNQLQRLKHALPAAPIVVLAGNHDTPRSVETGTILHLFEAIDGVHVVSREAKHLVFEEQDLALLCVPHAALVPGPRPRMVPERGQRWNVLLIHGELPGLVPRDQGAFEYGGAILEPSELHMDRWDYTALGHYHVARRMHPKAWYCGAIEYTSTNAWGELAEEARDGREGQKGWLLVELAEVPIVTFHPISLARRFLDLPPIHATGLDSAALDRLIAERLAGAEQSIDDQVVRQVVFDVSRLVARDLNHEQVRQFKARALHYQLDLRRPAQRARSSAIAEMQGKRVTMPELVVEYLRKRTLTPGVESEPLITLARRVMERVEREAGEAVQL